MELSAEDLLAVTGCGGEMRVSVRGEERRRSPRVPVAVGVGVYRLAGGVRGGAVLPRIHGRTREVSATGVGLVLSKTLEEGEVFIVGLPRRQGATLWVYCTVVRVSARGAGMYFVGAKFEEVVKAEQLKQAMSAVG